MLKISVVPEVATCSFLYDNIRPITAHKLVLVVIFPEKLKRCVPSASAISFALEFIVSVPKFIRIVSLQGLQRTSF